MHFNKCLVNNAIILVTCLNIVVRWTIVYNCCCEGVKFCVSSILSNWVIFVVVVLVLLLVFTECVNSPLLKYQCPTDQK